MNPPEPELAIFLQDAGLAEAGELGDWTPLTGGVSSDIWRVSLRSGEFCVKRALAQLKVSAEWKAPVERNATEWAYLEVVSAIAPGAVPNPVAHDSAAGMFAMEWLPPKRFPLWKTKLLAGKVDPTFAASVGELLGKIHSATADDQTLARRFDTDGAFHALRLDPYLLVAADRNPQIARSLRSLVELTAATRRVLVHGDVSPKNILLGDRPVLLDAEVAWFGDPAFDLAFCLNHLVIKRRILPNAANDLDKAFDALTAAYLRQVTWEATAEVEARAARLLPALALARVDGKSPVEYLSDEQRSALRSVSIQAITSEPATLDQARDLLVDQTIDCGAQ